jgi:hypothetical protein
MSRRTRTIVAIVVASVAIPGIALASWVAVGGGGSFARAVSMPAGATPTAVVTAGRNVEVAWSQATLPDGSGVGGYVIRRYDGAGTAQTIGSGCDGLVAALTCTEGAVPPGTWRYTVTPRLGGWAGAESAPSAPVTIAPPSLTLSAPSWITSLPANLPASVSGFAAAESVTFRLDDPTSGTVLTASPPLTVDGSGTGSTTVTIPNGTADGVHDVYALGSLGSVASDQIRIDRTGPAISVAALIKAEGGTSGHVHQGGTYHVYASAADAGSGVATVSADASSITTGATSVSLSAGSWTIRGVTYGYRSALLTANGTLAEGAKALTVSATDVAGNTSVSSPGATVDNTAPSAADVQSANASGGTVGKAEAADTLTLTFSEPIEPESLVAGWDGSSTTVTLRIISAGASEDRAALYDAANTTQLQVGTIRLGSSDYATATVSFTDSSMRIVGSSLVITLGTPNAPASLGTVTTAGTMRYGAASSLYDRAANACSTANANETGPSDVEF